ncbi:hypothetical protein BJ875DRAFT_486996 [Amylocarpus encephaloides]|uniref:Uncharacterized protein n=1 Tax=Amylocarpus encephaloides TaxID=45428 RepID=A0A9P7YE64_9HELO|nr:hypothetical protein BJ875DRAFT_486996 [Amylocarpus encephaloides]
MNKAANHPGLTAPTNVAASRPLDVAVDDHIQRSSGALGKKSVTKSMSQARGYGHGHPPASMSSAGRRSYVMATDAKNHGVNISSEATVKGTILPLRNSHHEHKWADDSDSHVHPNAPAAPGRGPLTRSRSARSSLLATISKSTRQSSQSRQLRSSTNMASPNPSSGVASDSLAGPESVSIIGKRKAPVSSSDLRDEASLESSATSSGRYPTNAALSQTTAEQTGDGDDTAAINEVFRQGGIAGQPMAIRLDRLSGGDCELLSPITPSHDGQFHRKGQEKSNVDIGNSGSNDGQELNNNSLDQATQPPSGFVFPPPQFPFDCNQCLHISFPLSQYDLELPVYVLRCTSCKRIIGDGKVVGENGYSYYDKDGDKAYLDWCVEYGILEVLRWIDAESEAASFASFDEGWLSSINYNFDYTEGLEDSEERVEK